MSDGVRVNARRIVALGRSKGLVVPVTALVLEWHRMRGDEFDILRSGRSEAWTYCKGTPCGWLGS